MRSLVAALSLLLVAVSGAAAESDAAELAHLRKQSRDAVIPLDDNIWNDYVDGPSRPYAVVIFYSAQQVIEQNPNLRLDELRREFGLAATAFARGSDADKVFFFEAALETSQKPFAMLQVNALPYVVRIPPSLSVSGGTVEVPKVEKMLPDSFTGAAYPWPAEAFIEHMGTRVGLSAAAVDRPSIYKSPFFPFIVFGALVTAMYLGYKIYMLALLRHAAIWAVVSMAIFWFSASGGMYNIIRGVPFWIRDRNGRLQFFLTGGRGALGAEGFVLGSLYLAISLSIAFITFLAPRISSRIARDLSSTLGALVATAAFYQTFQLWSQKTGYRHSSFLMRG
ncbi:hypothetical protein HYH03_012667 [Edaphochlamys debaryana]|uniref:Uncharacterized protein n=1 Tax=Edaphochlamys debaryana TaxID=47281 RepID=A0A835XSJ0_9CHLO|nr:hypothetical protein HYH03_012667 [Edaphochlamys debaryana]|eukprot:KAG2488872.1 hypothetical protein HYH03_012667 [Edaphochlamys debaryana]